MIQVEVGNPNVVWSASEDGTLRQHDFREGASCPHAGSSNQECRNVLVCILVLSHLFWAYFIPFSRHCIDETFISKSFLDYILDFGCIFVIQYPNVVGRLQPNWMHSSCFDK